MIVLTQIKALDQKVAEQIAAGEVIENPTSVVKELVENALDAGADRITVAIQEGGKHSITVTDNGHGIAASDLTLAFRRFATSKISALDDLERISSLGFRGEALPSIAAVSRVSLITRPASALAAARITLAGGEILAEEESGAPPGTLVEVRDLFYNTPGRRKFLRAAAVETARISALLTELSLARPAVSFTLTSGKRTLIQSQGDGNLLHAVASLYGTETASAFLQLERRERETGLGLAGLASAPRLTRLSRKWITTTINGRLVRNPLIVNALERGYGDLLPSRRHPLAILHLVVPPDRVDVNVHPAKTEIRLQEPENVKNLVYRAVKETLLGSSTLAASQAGEKPDRVATRPFQVFFEQVASYDPTPRPDFPVEARPEPDPPQPAPPSQFLTCRLIGQFLHSYLVAQRGDQLLLIDQHAAHERVICHRLEELEQSKPGDKSSQLTLPLTLELPTAWQDRIKRLMPHLESIGYRLEPLGETSYAVRAVPFLPGAGAEVSLYDLLEELFEDPDTPGAEPRNSLHRAIACRQAIKAGQPLSEAEMNRLLTDWEQTPKAQSCPHGRPAVMAIERSRLDQFFLRRGS